MPLQNRVRPDGEIFATNARGTFLGNRGILHDERQQIIRQSRGDMWLICQLEFKGRKQELMHPNRYTQLFFLDEAVGLAAGHRPCGECRRKHYRAYIDAANAQNEDQITGASNFDKLLSASRRAPRTTGAIGTLPDGVFIKLGPEDFRLVWQGALHKWSPGGYVDAVAIADIEATAATVVTPALSVAALRHGYPVSVHPSVASRAPEMSPVVPMGTPPKAAPMEEATPEVLVPKGASTEEVPTKEVPTEKAPVDVEAAPMAALTPDLRSEVEQILRTSSPGLTHGEVFRYMEQGLNAEEIASRHGTGLSHIQGFMRSLAHLFDGTMPTSVTAAQTNAWVYKEFLNHQLSPGLLNYVQQRLRRLREINPKITMEPLRTRSHQYAPKETRPSRQTNVCPTCYLEHVGECV